MNRVEIEIIPYFDDNYSYLVHHREPATTVLVDCGEAAPVIQRLDNKNWSLDAILLTHFHGDHTGDTAVMLQRFPKAKLYFPFGEKRLSFPGIGVRDNEKWKVGEIEIEAVDVSAHTLPNFCYSIGDALFTGDALFSAGCGRLFEGSAADLLRAMDRLASFPKETKIYFGHEYTLTNLKFAERVEPGNERIREYVEECQTKQKKGGFTTPSTLAVELEMNPFLRVDEPEIIRYTDPKGTLTRIERMKTLRASRNNF